MRLPGGPTTVLVIAKEPVPGRVKTRLTPPYTPAEAARLARASLADTLETVRAVPARRRVLALDGTPGDWLPPGIDVVPQAGGGLDDRIAAAFAVCDGPALLIGMDTPQLTPGHLAPALAPHAWDHCDAWFGPADDGGFWALGLAVPHPELLRGVPMSTPVTGAAQLARLTAAGLTVGRLGRLRDVDTAEDVAHVARQAPRGRFAAAYRLLPATRARPRPDGPRSGETRAGDPHPAGSPCAGSPCAESRSAGPAPAGPPPAAHGRATPAAVTGECTPPFPAGPVSAAGTEGFPARRTAAR